MSSCSKSRCANRVVCPVHPAGSLLHWCSLVHNGNPMAQALPLHAGCASQNRHARPPVDFDDFILRLLRVMPSSAQATHRRSYLRLWRQGRGLLLLSSESSLTFRGNSRQRRHIHSSRIRSSGSLFFPSAVHIRYFPHIEVRKQRPPCIRIADRRSTIGRYGRILPSTSTLPPSGIRRP